MAPKEKSSAHYSQQELINDLQNDNLFFDTMVDMIPAKLYVAGNSGDDYNPKYFKGQSKESKEVRRAQNKQAKRVKLNPATAETTTQMKKRLEEERNNTSSSHGKNGNKKKSMLPTNPSATLKGGKSKKTKSATTGDDENNGDNGNQAKNDDTNNANDNTANNKSRIELLREKLHAKLAEKRGRRPADPSTVSKRAARRAEKKKRQEEAAAKRNKKASSSKAETDKNTKYSIDSTTTTSYNNDNVNNPAADLQTVDYGLLAGLNPATSSNDHYQKTNKSLANMSKTKNLQKMLADAEAKKQRLEELKQGTEEEKQKALQIQWNDTIKEAAGQRIKEDPVKLKKALKRKEVQKKKSAKAWKTRMEQTKQKMDEKQKIRNHNLSKRKTGGAVGANLSKKRIVTEEETKSNTKGKNTNTSSSKPSRAGFEGRKQGFLNGNNNKGKGQ